MEELKDIYPRFLQCTGISIDTRTLIKGQCFVALKGPNFDGHDYIAKALELGASLVISNITYPNPRVAHVSSDTLSFLQRLASYHRMHFDIPILALTGSNGKTTTKELIASVLSQAYKVHYTQGNLNNHIGVPLTILNMPIDTEIAIIEMGANHQREIAGLCEIAQPTLGLITNIGKAHLEGFGGVEGVRKGKGEMFDYLKANNRMIVYDLSNNTINEMVGDYPVTLAFESNQMRTKMTSETCQFKDENGDIYSTHLSGDYNIPNIAYAYHLGQYFDIDEKDIIEALTSYRPDNMRSQILKKGDKTIILDAYNANPSSMLAALNNLATYSDQEKLIILGEMKELGEDTIYEHKQILTHIDQTITLAEVYLVGNHWKNLGAKKHHWFETTDDLKSALSKNPSKATVILIKGSRSNKLETLMSLWQ